MSVFDKIESIFICKSIEGTTTDKFGRNGEKYLATNEVNPELMKLLEEKIPYKVTGKVDGTCCLIRDGKLYKRRDIKGGRNIPDSWFQTGKEGKSNHLIGFMDLEKGDWHLNCLSKIDDITYINVLDNLDGCLEYKKIDIKTMGECSVELMGPKIQSNPHHLKMYCVMKHGCIVIDNFPVIENIEHIRDWFLNDPRGIYLEGVVIHFDNNKMFKLHRHHLDLIWSKDVSKPLDEIKLN